MKGKDVFFKAGILLLSLLLLLGLAGCGANSSLKETPTSPMKPTLTPVPTSTPTPMSTPLPDFPLPAGWRDYSISGFCIALPEQWKSVDVDEEGIEAILDLLKGLNTEWAQNTASMFSAKTLQETIKFWAMDSEPAGMGYASVNVIFQSSPIHMSIDDLCTQIPLAYKQTGIQLIDTKRGLEINGLDVARFEVRLRAGSLRVKQYQYVYVQGKNIWTLTLAVDETHWAKYQPVFVNIAESFRVSK